MKSLACLFCVLLVVGCTSSSQNAVTSGDFNVSIVDYSCSIVSFNEFNPNAGVVRVRASGWAVSWTTDVLLGMPSWVEVFDCGAWSKEPGPYPSACIREEGQPEFTNWSASSGDITILGLGVDTDINALVTLDRVREVFQARDFRESVPCVVNS